MGEIAHKKTALRPRRCQAVWPGRATWLCGPDYLCRFANDRRPQGTRMSLTRFHRARGSQPAANLPGWGRNTLTRKLKA
jgi:hypothetical protein